MEAIYISVDLSSPHRYTILTAAARGGYHETKHGQPRQAHQNASGRADRDPLFHRPDHRPCGDCPRHCCGDISGNKPHRFLPAVCAPENLNDRAEIKSRPETVRCTHIRHASEAAPSDTRRGRESCIACLSCNDYVPAGPTDSGGHGMIRNI